MDPNRVFKEILYGLLELTEGRGSRESVITNLGRLKNWLEHGGFPPRIDSIQYDLGLNIRIDD